MTGSRPTRKTRPQGQEAQQAVAMENFVRLQQHQAEYLKWLEESEKKRDMDRYSYKKVR